MFLAPATAWLLWSGDAASLDEDAGPLRTLIWYCQDAPLEDTSFPGCVPTLNALKVEIGSASLQVVAVDAQNPAPEDPRVLAVDHDAIFVAWVVPGTGGADYVLFAYDALNYQFVSREVVLSAGVDPPDAESVAFLYRNMLGTSLFADLESIETDVGLWGLAFPAEKVKKFKDVEGLNPPPVAPGPVRVHIDLSYLLDGYPAASRIWHQISPGVHGMVHRLLEVWLALGASPGPAVYERDALGLVLKLWLVETQAGLRFKAFSRGVFTLLPGVGVGLDVSIMDLDGGTTGAGQARRADLRAAGLLSVLARFMLHRHVGLGLEIGAKVLFNTGSFCIDEPGTPCATELMDYGRVSIFARMGVVFGL